jgi:hypothetical protein
MLFSSSHGALGSAFVRCRVLCDASNFYPTSCDVTSEQNVRGLFSICKISNCIILNART